MDGTAFVSVGELAERLSLTRAGVYARIARGRVPAVRTASGRIMVPRAAFEKWLAGQVERALAAVEHPAGGV